MYTRFRLVLKSMTLNNLWARFKVIDSLYVLYKRVELATQHPGMWILAH